MKRLLQLRTLKRRGIEWVLLAAWLAVTSVSLLDGPTPDYISNALDRRLALAIGAALAVTSQLLLPAVLRSATLLAAILVLTASFVVVGWS
jgi:hypothetical protein